MQIFRKLFMLLLMKQRNFNSVIHVDISKMLFFRICYSDHTILKNIWP